MENEKFLFENSSDAIFILARHNNTKNLFHFYRVSIVFSYIDFNF